MTSRTATISFKPSLHQSVGDIEQRMGYRLHRTNLLLMQVLRDRLHAIGLTPARASTLAFVRTNPGSGQSDLARALAMNRASAMEMVNVLCAIDAIERRPGRNSRIHALHITAHGEALHGRFVDATIDLDALIHASLSEAEQAQLGALIDRIGQSVQNYASIENTLET